MSINRQPMSIPLTVHGVTGTQPQPVRGGIPLPRGSVFSETELQLSDASGLLPCQLRVSQRWPDRSIKWLLLDTQLQSRDGTAQLNLQTTSAPVIVATWPRLQVVSDENRIQVDTGVASFTLAAGSTSLLREVRVGADVIVDAGHCVLQLEGLAGQQHVARITRVWLEETGALRATAGLRGNIRLGKQVLELQLRLSFYAGTGRVRCEVLVRNPQAAHHPGGLWDLGDRGSILFRELSLLLRPMLPEEKLRWRTAPDTPWCVQAPDYWSLYQDSSGGEHWDSDNHVDRDGKPAVRFRGYRVLSGALHQHQVDGHRAQPALWCGAEHWVALTVEQFWQNFPKALRWQDGVMQAALFPCESAGAFELQGGEQKRHVVWLEFGRSPQAPALAAEAALAATPEWVADSAAVPYLAALSDTEACEHRDYVASMVTGPYACVAKREVIDEYGWRNYGDLYADHEAVRHVGPRPMVSHYNNQYDFVYGSVLQYLRSGDARWWELCSDAARHLMDIDIYHTDQDKAAFNGGLFWHTDHYQPAATCTHRTYSRRNGGAGYGGGPSNEHNYTSGLLHYYLMSGDEQARDTVVGLADWVINMDDGGRNVFALLDSSATGLASKTLSGDYHHPGRGAGNSINALLDAYALTGRRQFVAKAEELVQRCIHPEDDIAALKLDEPEYRWSYLVFLQILGKYLEFKREWGELDYCFYYARDSLLRYAAWMAAHELPYKRQLHKVEIPTETWPAHDVRKAHVLHLAAKYAPDSLRADYTAKAIFFQDNCLRDLLGFDTAYLTRPQVILSVYGHVDAYFRQHADEVVPYVQHNYHFGTPQQFVSQRDRLGGALRNKLQLLRGEMVRVMQTVADRVRSRFARR